MTPSLKVVEIEMNSLIMGSGDAKADVDWDAGETDDNTGVGFIDYGASNGTSVDWDF